MCDVRMCRQTFPSPLPWGLLRAAGNQNKLWNHIPYATALNCLHPFPHWALKVEISSDSQQMFSLLWKLISGNILRSIDLHNTTRGWRKFWIVFAVIIQHTLRVFFNSTSSVLSSLVSINYSSMAETINMLALKHNSPYVSQEHPYALFCVLKTTTMALPFAIIDDALQKWTESKLRSRLSPSLDWFLFY